MSSWYSFNDQMREIFGGKVYRLSLSAGCTCPNRDGTLARGGCIFCSAGGSGDFAAAASANIPAQIEEAKRRVNGKIGKNTEFAGYMAYFQSFTNTYGDTGYLVNLFEAAAAQPDVIALSIATRPDCLKEEMVRHLAEINRRIPVFVELGLQTVHEETASYINRFYPLVVFKEAFRWLKSAGLRVVVHVMIGLPGENSGATKETVSYLAELEFQGAHIDGIKLALLYVLRGTKLADRLPDDWEELSCDPTERPRHFILLRDGMKLPQYTLPEYAALIRELADLLPPETALHRVTGDPPKRDLLLPTWTADKKRVLNTIRAEFDSQK